LGHETKTGGVNRLCKYPENRGKLNYRAYFTSAFNFKHHVGNIGSV
jgi:hypothetical protein